MLTGVPCSEAIVSPRMRVFELSEDVATRTGDEIGEKPGIPRACHESVAGLGMRGDDSPFEAVDATGGHQPILRAPHA